MQYFDTIKNHNYTLTNEQIKAVQEMEYPFLIVVFTSVMNSCDEVLLLPNFELECNNVIWELDLTIHNSLYTGDWNIDLYLSENSSTTGGFLIDNDLIKIKYGC